MGVLVAPIAAAELELEAALYPKSKELKSKLKSDPALPAAAGVTTGLMSTPLLLP